MRRIVPHAVASFRDEELNAVGLVFAESEDGSGRRLEIQRPISVDDDDRRSGMDTYCLVNESGATHYGGVRRWILNDNELQLILDPDAANILGVDGEYLIQLAVSSPTEDEMRAALSDLIK